MAKDAPSTDAKLEDAKEAFRLCVDHEAQERKEMLDDIKFARLAEQWPEVVRRGRERDGRPCLTINRMPSFIRQVVNDARQNKPSIKVRPVDDTADPDTAEVISGLIRNIEYSSNADVAYDTAVESAVTCGRGYFRINTQYAGDDTFDQDIVIERIANPFSVWGDPFSQAADSSDWNLAFIAEMMPKTQFRRQFRGAEEVDWDSLGYEGLEAPWREDESVMLAEYWSREEVASTILMLAGPAGQLVVTADDMKVNATLYQALGYQVAGERPSKTHKVRQCLMTGAEILSETEWVGKYIPIVPVYGDEINVEGKRYFRSLIRDAKDPQRMFNYWRTAATELVALAPKAPYIGRKGAFDTDGAKWATANSESHAYIEYDGPEAPQRQPFAGVPAGALQEALNASDDMKSIMGLFDASLGARSNETSGRAIMARQREGDVSTFHFIDNLNRAIRHAGRILIDLIPQVYSTERVIRVIGEDGEGKPKPINQQFQDPVEDPMGNETGEAIARMHDLTTGKYDLVVSSGPSFTSRREEAAFQMQEMIRAYPAIAPVIGDIMASNLDWPGADKIAERLKALQQGQGGDPQAQQQLQDLAQQVQDLQAQLDAEKADKSVEAGKLQIDAYAAETDRMKVVADASRPEPVPSRQA